MEKKAQIPIEVEIDNLILYPDSCLPGFYSATFDFVSLTPLKTPFERRAFRLLEKRFSDILLKEIAVDAIDIVEFFINETDIADEFIAHKLGLIPLRRIPGAEGEREVFEAYIQAPCNGYLFSAADLESTKDLLEPCVDMPLVVMNKGQKLQFRAFTKVGLGEEHSKFRPVVNPRASPPEEGGNIYQYRVEFNCQVDPDIILTYALNQAIAQEA